MLTKKGTRLLLKLVVPDGRLPDIVKEFLNHASQLKDIVHNETLAIVQDIKTMLYDEQSRHRHIRTTACVLIFYSQSVARRW